MLRSPTGERSSSNPDLPGTMEDPGINFVSFRKRKCRTDLDDITSLHSEIKNMLNIFKTDSEGNNAKLYEAIEELRNQNKEIIKTNSNIEKILEHTTTMYNEIKLKVDKISTEHDDALLKIENLEGQVEELQRAQKITMVEIKNIPLTANENLEDVLTTLHNSLRLPFSPNNIKQVRRLKNTSQKLIIVEFQTSQQSKALLKAVKEYNRLNPENKFNTQILNQEGEKQPIYVTESLTPRARKLHYLARDLRKYHNYKHCWTSYGKVLVKQSDDSQAIVIQSEQQIEILKGSTSSQ